MKDTYLMPRADIIKSFHLDQKLLKIIFCNVTQRFWNKFLGFFDKYWPRSVCLELAFRTSVDKGSASPEVFPKGIH